MVKDGIFRIEWGTGEMNVSIAGFFLEAAVPRVKKLCKLARQYSTAEDQHHLLFSLIQEDRDRKELLDKLVALSEQKARLADEFFHTNKKPEPGWAEMRLVSEHKKLAQAIDIITAERWRN